MSQPFGSIEVEKGTVIHAAGENPTDVQARWLGVTQEMGIDPDTMDVHFINGVVKISENVANIEAEVATKKLQPTLVIVDTVAAYFEGDDDNDNVQMGNYARLLRSMTNLPGGPCVLALAHPTKRAADDDLIPKGGGAFLNEVDGNVALRRNGQVIAFEALGKFRGPSFEPVHFELVTVQHPKLRDTKGAPSRPSLRCRSRISALWSVSGRTSVTRTRCCALSISTPQKPPRRGEAARNERQPRVPDRAEAGAAKADPRGA